MNNKITENSKPFEILEARDPEYLSEAVNEALELGYELSWGGLNSEVYGHPFSFPETTFVQAVILKDKKKFENWAKEKIRIKEEAKKKAETEEKEHRKKEEESHKKVKKAEKRVLGKPVLFQPEKNRRAIGGKGIVKHVLISLINYSPTEYKIKRDKVHGYIWAKPSEITFLKEKKK